MASAEAARTIEILYEHTDVVKDDAKRRGEFAVRLVELADEFDSLDHQFGPTGGTILQSDCAAVRDLARSIAAEDSTRE